MTAEYGSYVITYCDLAYSLMFLLFIWYWGFKLDRIVEAVDEEVTMTSDYSVCAGRACPTRMHSRSCTRGDPAHTSWSARAEGHPRCPHPYVGGGDWEIQ